MTKADKNRQLNQNQLNAIEMLLQGRNDGEVADTVGVSRQTVNEWKNHDPHVIAEINLRRKMIWESQVERLRGLIAGAVDVLELDLQSNDPKDKRTAAIHILRCVGLYGEKLKPTGDTSPESIEHRWEEEKFWDGISPFGSKRRDD